MGKENARMFGAVLSMRRAEDMPLLERWVHTADPLHFGDFGVLWFKPPWLSFGLIMCGLVASGVLVYAKRTSKALSKMREESLTAARRTAE